MSEAAYTPELTIGLCRLTHHRWDTFRLFAEWVGIRLPRHVFDRDPVAAVDEAAQRRVTVAGGPPSWWTADDVARWETNRSHYPTVG